MYMEGTGEFDLWKDWRGFDDKRDDFMIVCLSERGWWRPILNI